MFFIEKKPEKPNIGKIVAISVGVTFAVAAAAASDATVYVKIG